MFQKNLFCLLSRAGSTLAMLAALAGVTPADAAPPASSVQTISDSALKALSTTIGGADVLPTTRTVAHWWGATTDPTDGITYGYNMVGADPDNCSGSACSTTVVVDIVPVNVSVGGLEFNGSDVVNATLASPQFSLNDYGSTPAATNAGFARGAGGALSQGLLQLQDATMRSQFNQTGSSAYHLILNPVVHDPVTLTVPRPAGVLLQSGRGVIFGDVSVQWWATQLQKLNGSLQYVDPTHLVLYLTHDVLLFSGTNPLNCCIIGFHGAALVPGNDIGSVHGQGNQPVQTYAWASYVSAGIYARPNGGVYWALQDIHAVSHEIAEWADDPFINNTVQPWLTPTAPQYGCTGWLETGDPVVAIGFAMGTNTFAQGPNPNGTQSADGYYHPEDEAFLPWFLRSSPNTISEPTQSPSANIGRYTFMGDLNPFPGFRAPATGCQ